MFELSDGTGAVQNKYKPKPRRDQKWLNWTGFSNDRTRQKPDQRSESSGAVLKF